MAVQSTAVEERWPHWPSGREQFVATVPVSVSDFRHKEAALVRMLIEDGLGRINEAAVKSDEIGLVVFRQYLDGPKDDVCVFVDGAVQNRAARAWLEKFLSTEMRS